MRGLAFTLPLALSSYVRVHADNTISVSASDDKPGAEVGVSVAMTNTDGIVAAEFEIPLDGNMTYVDGSFSVEADRLVDHQTSISYSDGTLRVYIFGTSLTALTASSGTFFSFKLRLGSAPGKYSLTPKVILSNAEGKKVDCTVKGTSVTILASLARWDTTSIDFGHVPVKSTYEKTVVLSNTGTSRLTVSSIAFTSDAFTCTDTSFSIEAGGSKTLTVVFAPQNYGTVNESLTIESDAAGGAQTVELRADPYSVNELHVGSAEGKYNTEAAVALDMTNMEEITAVQCTFELPEEVEYVTNSFAASDRCAGFKTISSVSGNRLNIYLYSLSGDVIAAGEGEIGTLRLKLKGATGSYALTPQEVVLGNGSLTDMTSAVTSGTVTVVSPVLSCDSELDMLSVSLTETANRTFTLTNTGQSELTVTSVTFNDDSLSVADTFPIIVYAGDSHELHVAYKPHEAGDFNGVMNIYSDNPLERLTKVDVHGTVYEPNTLSVSSSSDESKSTCTVTVSMDNYSDIVALQVDIEGVEGLSVSKADIVMHDRCTGLSSAVTWNGDGSCRVIIYSLTDRHISGHSGPLFSLTFTDSQSGSVGTRIIDLKNAVLSNRGSENMASDDNTESFILGDANGNGVVNVADISAVVSHIYGHTPTGFNFKAADANASGSINVADITEIVKLIYSK